MKVLLLEDVYKLGRAGEVKKVAPGYGRNFLIPQGLAVLATPGAMKQAERIKTDADAKRAVLNKEMSVIAERLQDVTLTFPAKASETGRLYGSINTRMMAEAISEEAGIEISHRQVESQPLRMIGEHTVEIRLTVDQIPKIRAIVYREGETPALALEEEAAREAEAEAAPGEPVEAVEAFDASAVVSEAEEEAETEIGEPAEAVEASTTESEAAAEAEAAPSELVEAEEAFDASAVVSEAEEEAETEISEPAEAVEASTTESEAAAEAEAAPSELVDEAEVSEKGSEEEAKAEAEVEPDLESEAEESEETPPEAVEE